MSPRTLGPSEVVSQYLMQVGLREPDVLRLVRQDTARLPGAHMQIAPEHGQLMALLARLTNACSYLEIGTYGGARSALAKLERRLSREFSGSSAGAGLYSGPSDGQFGPAVNGSIAALAARQKAGIIVG